MKLNKQNLLAAAVKIDICEILASVPEVKEQYRLISDVLLLAAQACDGFDAAFPSQTQGLSIDNPVRAHLTQLREARREGYLAGVLSAQAKIAELRTERESLISENATLGVQVCELKAELEGAHLLELDRCKQIAELEAELAEAKSSCTHMMDTVIKADNERDKAIAERDRLRKVNKEHFDCYQDAITSCERYRKERDAAIKETSDTNYRLGYTQAFLTTALDEVKRMESAMTKRGVHEITIEGIQLERPTAAVAMLAEREKKSAPCQA